jgi:hypothetical protein
VTREELDRLHEIATSGPNGIAKITDHISRLEREARAGRELRKTADDYSRSAYEKGLLYTSALLIGAVGAYDTATESKHE